MGETVDFCRKKYYYINNLYMLSRVDERIGFITPQQPINLGANTDKA